MKRRITVDGNHAVARIAYRASEVIAIYPITPSSSMGELADEWAAAKKTNLWGAIPSVTEMQSEAGAAGAVHGALQAGALATTFTASQGLLLMIPNLYKIAGELTPFCMHVAARTVATHALSIFGDHSDVMACRPTGVALLCSGSVQEAQDLACVAHAATLASRVPFIHFFDGFRTSHEVAKIDVVEDEVLRALIPEELVAEHRRRALTPDHPVVRGTAHNPDTWFQAREASSPWTEQCPDVVASTMAHFAELTGRSYHLFDYVGHAEAERVIVMMGSGAETAQETVEHLVANGERVGLVKVRLYRPFDTARFVAALPPTVKQIAVLDRTKEPGATAEPLCLDVMAALVQEWSGERALPLVRGGRYGLSSKEFTPAMVKGVYDNLAAPRPRDHFTVGIVDDVMGSSLPWDPTFTTESDDVERAVFFGLGSDGTVGANKNTIQILGEATDRFVQGYFVYDSKKSGAVTVSHLRSSPRPIRSAYLIDRASFVGCHQLGFLERYDVLACAGEGATLLVNAPHAPRDLWDALPLEVQQEIVQKHIRLFTIDAVAVATKAGMGGRINTVMQACHFALSGVLPREVAVAKMKAAIEKSYGKKGGDAVTKNFAAVDAALASLHEVKVPAEVTATRRRPPAVPANAPDFVARVTAALLEGHGDRLPVSAFPPDGTWPVGTARFERRHLARELPVLDDKLCIQCNKCALVCPHAAIRAKVVKLADMVGAPPESHSVPYRGTEYKGDAYVLQVAPDDCTGCSLCVHVCPAVDKTDRTRKALVMQPEAPLVAKERVAWEFFRALPEAHRTTVHLDVKGSQLLEPLFEASGACAGCGETPYIKLLTQLYGDRVLIANATGCSSIFGGNLPTTPYSTNREGRGPAWANPLFEDNAEFGLGMRLGVDVEEREAHALLARLAPVLPPELVAMLAAPVGTEAEAGLGDRRAHVEQLRRALAQVRGPLAEDAARLQRVADALVHKQVWIIGGDGWAYDIGYGGLDHVLASGADVNVLVLDTEVYSNTGGQQSKASPMGAAARFAVEGKATAKKDLGLLAMTYGHIYVASIAMGARDAHAVKVLQEAASYPGPSLVIAYAHCIAHGFDLADGMSHQRLAVEAGYWPLYRFDPRRAALGEPALKLDSGAPADGELAAFMHHETRFRTVEEQQPARFAELLARARLAVTRRYETYRRMAGG